MPLWATRVPHSYTSEKDRLVVMISRRDEKKLSAETLNQRARELAKESSIMILGTCGPEGPWAAPVYYVFSEGTFWFFSSPESRHIRHGRQASASVYQDGGHWKKIRGLQMTGRIRPGGSGSASAFAKYVRKFSFIREMAGAGMCDPAQFGERFGNRFFRFIPEYALYGDNRLGFGFKEKVAMKEGENP
ncbi:pyridoxamine 5'-phosphate oxidase family protein [Desulfobotulus sp. H1]|uniref:Pyridoxamine 5'-phosphate oxidase family protein n=1 Tax=Desulfobotulus pelophilus TaxID=2823377 RepID=A0ABT3NAK1_9BACT|nr:pyridoxamine 5'-phosphate oxidase family protein [Desulfobotulus pelophilus]MCW7754491.1 pyridoxamine 5'-phosphate oxidase family protein [Desulfobotulus pelophilus]